MNFALPGCKVSGLLCFLCSVCASLMGGPWLPCPPRRTTSGCWREIAAPTQAGWGPTAQPPRYILAPRRVRGDGWSSQRALSSALLFVVIFNSQRTAFLFHKNKARYRFDRDRGRILNVCGFKVIIFFVLFRCPMWYGSQDDFLNISHIGMLACPPGL